MYGTIYAKDGFNMQRAKKELPEAPKKGATDSILYQHHGRAKVILYSAHDCINLCFIPFYRGYSSPMDSIRRLLNSLAVL